MKRTIQAIVALVLVGGSLLAQNAEQKPMKPMAADADPSFEVVSLRPNNGASFSLLNIRGDRYVANNVCLSDLLKFAYRIHSNEVVGLPDWALQERYDLSAKTQPEGSPNFDQLRIMLKKFLAERFKLAIHTEQRVLPVYVMTVAKGGLKLEPSKNTVTGDTIHESKGGIQMTFTHGTTKAYADFLQQAVVDRPVLDRTGLTDRYDYNVTFLPDETMFGGRIHLPPNIPDAAPSLFTVLEEIGLKLTPDKVPVDVIVVDHAEKPAEN